MKDPSPTVVALGRAGRRAAYHLLQAAIESLKAIEAVIEEVGSMNEDRDRSSEQTGHKIEIE
ncbi:MAG: hypothetical protein U9N56_07445 [Actinomycetota bacterium]|nr:hypothetical protein [Actinomycetota bacterium]